MELLISEPCWVMLFDLNSNTMVNQMIIKSPFIKGILATPPQSYAPQPRNKGLIRPYFLGGVALGGGS